MIKKVKSDKKVIDDCIKKAGTYIIKLQGKTYCGISSDYKCRFQTFSGEYLKYCNLLHRQYEGK